MEGLIHRHLHEAMGLGGEVAADFRHDSQGIRGGFDPLEDLGPEIFQLPDLRAEVR